MNRETLFRGKRIDNKEWVEGYYVPIANSLYLIYTGKFEITRGGIYLDQVPVFSETIGQFTGLTDRNGRKIFEGDIVRLDNRSPEGSWTAVVEFGNPNYTYSWGYQLKRIGGDEGFNPDILLWIEMEETGATCEVIGNIHDELELLGGDNNA